MSYLNEIIAFNRLLNEIIAFNRLAKIERISPKEQALWHALMSIAYNLGWPEAFAVANLTLQSKAVLSVREIFENRNRLIQRGLIEYKARGGGKAPIYSLISIADKSDDKRGSHAIAQKSTVVKLCNFSLDNGSDS